jgi:hypothetical protein
VFVVTCRPGLTLQETDSVRLGVHSPTGSAWGPEVIGSIFPPTLRMVQFGRRTYQGEGTRPRRPERGLRDIVVPAGESPVAMRSHDVPERHGLL